MAQGIFVTFLSSVLSSLLSSLSLSFPQSLSSFSPLSPPSYPPHSFSSSLLSFRSCCLLLPSSTSFPLHLAHFVVQNSLLDAILALVAPQSLSGSAVLQVLHFFAWGAKTLLSEQPKLPNFKSLVDKLTCGATG